MKPHKFRPNNQRWNGVQGTVKPHSKSPQKVVDMQCILKSGTLLCVYIQVHIQEVDMELGGSLFCTYQPHLSTSELPISSLSVDPSNLRKCNNY